MIDSSIYNNKKKLRRVFEHKYTPIKNEIRYVYAGSKLETIFEIEILSSKLLSILISITYFTNIGILYINWIIEFI